MDALEIKLVDDWDVRTAPPRKRKAIQGHFAGRAREVEFLTNELLATPQRSIFISGHRGVGKTTLVYECLRLVLTRARAPKRTFLFVPVNAAQLEAEVTEKIVPREILKGLIRRLFAVAEQDGYTGKGRDRIDALYLKAVAAEFAERRRSTSGDAEIGSREQVVRVDFSLGRPAFAWVASLVAGGVLQGSPIFHATLLNRMVPLLLATPWPFAAAAALRRTTKSESISRRETTAEQYYALDHSLGNLEFDLERIHAELAESKVACIYIIDELDKLDRDLVVQILNYFKSLFTLSAAIFVFLGDEGLAQHLERPPDPEDDALRTKEYTYFTSRYSLARPAPADLRAYLDQVLELPQLDEDKTDLVERFKDLIVFEARSDFFDVSARLRDRISEFRDGRAVISMFDLSDADKLRVRMQRVVATLHATKHHYDEPSRWRTNEIVLRKLYESAHDISNAGAGATVADTAVDSPEEEARRDLHRMLARANALSFESAEDDVIIRGLPVRIVTYRVTGVFPRDPPNEVDFRTENERRFCAAFVSFREEAVAAANAVRAVRGLTRLTAGKAGLSRALEELAGLGADVRAGIARAEAAYDSLTVSTPPQSYSRQEIDEVITETESQRAALTNASPSVLAQVLVNEVPGSTTASLTGYTPAFKDEEVANFAAEAQALSHVVVRRDDTNREMLVIAGLDADLIEKFRSNIHNASPQHRILAIGGDIGTFERPRGLRTLTWDEAHQTDNQQALEWAVEWLAGN